MQENEYCYSVYISSLKLSRTFVKIDLIVVVIVVVVVLIVFVVIFNV